MADTVTAKGFVKPEVGASDDTWGAKTNTNWDLVDSLIVTRTVDNAFSVPQTISHNVANTALLELILTDAGTALGPNFYLTRNSSSPAASDLIGDITFRDKDSAGGSTYHNYASIYAAIIDPLTSSKDGELRFQTMTANTPSESMRIRAGVYTPNASGGDKGADTINATALYEAGVSLASKYAQLATNNVFTGINTFQGQQGPISINWNDNTAASLIFDFFRTRSSPSGVQTLTSMRFNGSNTAAALPTFVQLIAQAVSPTSGAEQGRLYVQTVNGGTISTVMRFDPDAAVMESLFDLGTIGQIKFPATQNPSTDANTLDDYEEKVFSPLPSITFGGASVGMTFASQTARYTKIGRLCFFEIDLTLSAKGSSTGVAAINNLPFTAAAAPAATIPIRVNAMASGVGDTLLAGNIGNGATTMRLDKYSAGSVVQLTEADFTATSRIVATGFYTVA